MDDKTSNEKTETATQTTAMMVDSIDEIPEWWPHSARQEVEAALECGTCVMLRKNGSVRFWQCTTEDEHALASWLLKALEAQP